MPKPRSAADSDAALTSTSTAASTPINPPSSSNEAGPVGQLNSTRTEILEGIQGGKTEDVLGKIEGDNLQDVLHGLAWFAGNTPSIRALDDDRLQRMFGSWWDIIQRFVNDKQHEVELHTNPPTQSRHAIPPQARWLLTCCSCGMQLRLHCACKQAIEGKRP